MDYKFIVAGTVLIFVALILPIVYPMQLEVVTSPGQWTFNGQTIAKGTTFNVDSADLPKDCFRYIPDASETPKINQPYIMIDDVKLALGPSVPWAGYYYNYVNYTLPTKDHRYTCKGILSLVDGSTQEMITFYLQYGTITEPPPAVGYMRIYATYNGEYIAATVSVSGPMSGTFTTTTDGRYPLKLELEQGTYTVSGTYAGIDRSKTVSVINGTTVDVVLNFGGQDVTPPPEAQLTPFGIGLSVTLGVVGAVLIIVGVLKDFRFGKVSSYGRQRR